MEQEPARLGDLLRSARKEKKLTQARVAAELGVTQSRISSFETGHLSALSEERIRGFAELLDLDPDEVLREASEARPRLCLCSSQECPGNAPSSFGDTVRFRPGFRVSAAPHCPLCGEPHVTQCENPLCDSEVQIGLNCPECGHEYVQRQQMDDAVEAARWTTERRSWNRELTEFCAERGDSTLVARPEVPR